ncbi:MAG: serine hydrolase domain-containing protein [Bacteroidota bacterium]
MNLFKIIFPFLFLILPKLAGQTESAPILSTKVLDYLSDNPKFTSLDSVVERVVTRFIQSPENCGISIGVSKNGSNFFYNYGETKRGSRQIPTPNSIYETGAVSKTFCAIILAQAVIEKKIDPEEDIRKYLPGKYANLRYGRSFIKIKHLANHTSGLAAIPDDLKLKPGFDSLNPYKHYTREMLLEYLKQIKPAAEPGTVCNYSSMGMALLGIILENVYQQPFEKLVKDKVAVPNHMSSTGINLTADQLLNFTEGHNGFGIATPHWEFDAFAPAGALKSSSSDLLKFLDYNLSGKDVATRLSHEISYSGRENVAMAWYVKKNENGNLFWHDGATYGYGCFVGFIKEKNCSVVILANSSTSVDFIALALLKYLRK